MPIFSVYTSTGKVVRAITSRPMTPEETLAFIQREQHKWAPILAQIGGTH